jgi:hypothetical protein
VRHCKIFRKKKTYTFSLSFYTKFRTCLQLQWCGGEILAKWDDSHSESGHSLPIHFKQIRLTVLLSGNFDFWNRKTSTNKPSATFTYLHCDCAAETWLVGKQRYRNSSVQSEALTVGWFQVLFFRVADVCWRFRSCGMWCGSGRFEGSFCLHLQC